MLEEANDFRCSTVALSLSPAIRYDAICCVLSVLHVYDHSVCDHREERERRVISQCFLSFMMLLSDASLLFFVPMAIEESETSKRHLNVSDHTLRGYLMHSQRMA